MPPSKYFKGVTSEGGVNSPLTIKLVLEKSDVSFTLSTVIPNLSPNEVPSKARMFSPNLRATVMVSCLIFVFPLYPREATTSSFHVTLAFEVSQLETRVVLTAQSNSSLYVSFGMQQLSIGGGLGKRLKSLSKQKYWVIQQFTFPSSSIICVLPMPQHEGPQPTSIPLPFQPAIPSKMPQFPLTLGLEKSPLTTMLSAVPCLTSFTVLISRPYESETPAPINWRKFLPGRAVTAMETGFHLQSEGTTETRI